VHDVPRDAAQEEVGGPEGGQVHGLQVALHLGPSSVA
jgi:hypothetical protein